MHKTTAEQETQGELLSLIARLEPGAMQAVLVERAKAAALTMAVALLEQDAEVLCGARSRRKGEGLCQRGGSEPTSVVLEGARYALRRPRVRKNNREMPLPTRVKLQSQDLLDQQMRQRMLLGRSTRNYDQVVEGDTQKLGVSRSSGSRAVVRASQQDLDSLNEGKLDDYTVVGLMIDGREIGGRAVVAGLGITADMEKIPLGLREGDTENTAVLRDLLASLQERGFTLHCERR